MLRTRGKISNGVPRRGAFREHLIVVAKKILRVVVLVVDQLIVLQTIDRQQGSTFLVLVETFEDDVQCFFE